MRHLALIALLLLAPLTSMAQAPVAALPPVESRLAHVSAILSQPDGRGLWILSTMVAGDPAPAVRAAAVQALGELRAASYDEVVRRAAEQDPDPQVRAAARVAYDRLWPLHKSPAAAAGWSLLCPGCGHFSLRRPGYAAAMLASTAALVVGGGVLMASSPARDGDGILGRYEDARGPIGLQLATAGQNLWFYSIFAAYRDARALRDDFGYTHPSSRESLADLVTAPVRPRVLARPWFWAGLPVMFGAALGASYLFDGGGTPRGGRSLFDGGGVNFLGRRFGTASGFALGELYYAGLFLPVGVGEEALFRGVIQQGLSESFGPWGGWAAASAIFGAVHVGNFLGGSTEDLRSAIWAVPFITAVGGYLGYVSMRTGYQLETSVALHVWYDFLIGTAYFLSDPDNQPFAVRVGWVF